MLEMVRPPGGTAPKAQVPGYRVGGKTGTAYKLEGHGYEQQVRRVVRRHRADVESAHRRRGDDRRAVERRVLRRRASPAPVFSTVDRRRAADAGRADRCAGRQRGAARRKRGRRTIAEDNRDARRRPRCSQTSPCRRSPSAARAARRASAADHRRQPRGASPATRSPPTRATQRDGRAFIGDAIARGAAAVLWETQGFAWNAAGRCRSSPVEDLQAAPGVDRRLHLRQPVADAVGGRRHRHQRQDVVRAVDRAGARRAAAAVRRSSARWATASSARSTAPRTTTPDAAALHERARAAARPGCAAAVAMEVSSHGLDQGRVNGIAFDVALFTNLTRDHLDYHGTMEAYGAAKAKLFAWPGLQAAVINVDDAFGAQLIDDAARRAAQRCSTYGRARRGRRGHRASRRRRRRASRSTVSTPCGRRPTSTTTLVGAFNVAEPARRAGRPARERRGARTTRWPRCRKSTPPPGRMQRLGGGVAADASSSTTRTRPTRWRRC